MESANPFASVRKQLTVNGKSYDYFSLPDLKDSRVGKCTFYPKPLIFTQTNFLSPLESSLNALSETVMNSTSNVIFPLI